MTGLIDAHQHFWRPSRGDYGWMDAEAVAPIRRPILPEDLAPILQRCGVERTVLVQAAPSLAETEYMLGLADATPSIAKVVGWIDFEDPGQIRALERLAKHPKLAGVRPMIQDIPDPEWMHRPAHAWAFDALVDLDLSFDALGFPQHLDPFLRLIAARPRLRVVVDHCMKPQIRDDAFDAWAEGIARIAASTGAFCKLSGIVTESAPGWTVETLRPYARHVLESFGAERVMWGSDWPVLELAGDYEGWLAAAKALVAPQEAAAVFSGTARAFYRI